MHDYEKDFPNIQNPNIGFLMFEISNKYRFTKFCGPFIHFRNFRQWFTCVFSFAAAVTTFYH